MMTRAGLFAATQVTTALVVSAGITGGAAALAEVLRVPSSAASGASASLAALPARDIAVDGSFTPIRSAIPAARLADARTSAVAGQAGHAMTA